MLRVTGHAENMQLSFPSKLTDYTAVGLPLLICGPKYCSAVRWAFENEPIAEVITSPEMFEFESSLSRLRDSTHRMALAWRALQLGEAQFAHCVGQQVFLRALAKN